MCATEEAVKEIYNENQKNRYLEYRKKQNDDIIPILLSVFRKINTLEETYEKDMCNFTREQCEDLMYYLGLGTFSSIAFVYYSLCDYVDWCMFQGLVRDGMNHMRDIDYREIGKYINKRITDSKIVTREDVLHFTTLLNNPRDALFLLSCFEFGVGREYKDFLNMELKDIDEENHILHLLTRDVKISSEWISVAKEAADTYEILSNVHEFDKPLVKKIKLEHTDKLFKNSVNIRANSSDKMLIQKRMARVFKSIKKTLGLSDAMKAQSIINSGRIHYINEKCKAENVDSSEYIKTHIKEIENQFGLICNPYVFIREYGNYLV